LAVPFCRERVIFKQFIADWRSLGWLQLFMSAPNNRRIKPTVEFVNYPSFEIEADSAWENRCREWSAANSWIV
jgi:hypothetical protein